MREVVAGKLITDSSLLSDAVLLMPSVDLVFLAVFDVVSSSNEVETDGVVGDVADGFEDDVVDDVVGEVGCGLFERWGNVDPANVSTRAMVQEHHQHQRGQTIAYGQYFASQAYHV
jgi:hypothetical protein